MAVNVEGFLLVTIKQRIIAWLFSADHLSQLFYWEDIKDPSFAIICLYLQQLLIRTPALKIAFRM